MASGNRRKLYGTTLLSGAVSISSYVLLYTHQEWVIRNFTRGGVYAVLPIATAFWFSFVHGTFTSCLLQVLGFRAAAGAAADKKRAGDSSQNEIQP
jgi:F0F1-type ATP synthase assembly protein I